jgi:putative ABC transport system permease protein
VAAHLKEGMGGRATGRSRTRSALVISQLSLSLVLLNAGGLVFATLGNYRTLVSVPEAERVLLVSLQPSLQGYTADRTREYFRQLLDRVQRLPGVTAATVARGVSLDDASFFPEAVSAGPGDAAPEGAWLDCAYAVVSPGFFRTMGVTLSRGRDFTPGDRTGAPPVVIVNATLAQRLWGGADPVGRVLWIRGERVGREVVGLASDRPTEDGPRPFLYEPLYQPYPWAASIHLLQVRTSGDPLALLPGIEREAAALDVSLRFFNPRLLEREIAGRRFFERLAGAVMGGSGLLALLLAMIGLYGVVSNWVSECTREIGIRMALGARAGHVLAHVVGRAVKLALTGVVIGGAMALVLNRLWTAWLFGARAAEPAVLAAAVLLLIATALVAGCLPALRATRVDPIGALRFE